MFSMSESGDTSIIRPIVAESTFILAARDTGYRSSAAAITELMDNSIQAGAKSIRVFITESGQRTLGVWHRDVQVAVLDNGRGMNKAELWSALQFGGSSRFADRQGLGRFGMGLPNSSVSQTRRIEVFSWRSPRLVLSTYLDVDEVASRKLTSIPEPAQGSLPAWAMPFSAAAGTLVVWPRCDRLDYRKATTLRDKLVESLGRTYRRAIWAGLNIFVNEQLVEVVDPLFCHPTTLRGGAAPYGSELTYEIATGARCKTSTVRIRFTELPVKKWAVLPLEAKRLRGIIGGAGLSFLRAGREIDNGWHLLGGKRRENYDDWWRGEVSFSPDLDEEFGVTHSKQGVSPSAMLRATLGPDLQAVARALNTRVRRKFECLKTSSPSRAVTIATRQDRVLPPAGNTANRITGTKGFTYVVVPTPLDSAVFFRADQRGKRVVVRVNTHHPFFERVYRPACRSGDSETRFAVESILLAVARADFEDQASGHAGCLQRHRAAWSDALLAFLDAHR